MSPLTVTSLLPLLSVLASALIGSSPVNASTEDCPIPFPETGTCASIEWTVPPVVHAEAKMVLRFWDPALATAEGPYSDPEGTPAVVLWMDMGGHGHGSAPTRVAYQEPGIFEVERMFFVMRGKWQIRVQLKAPDGELLEQAVVEQMIE